MVVAWRARLITRKKNCNEIKGLAISLSHCVATIHVLQSGTRISFSNFPMLKMFYSFIDFRVWRHRQPVGCVATNITWCSWTSFEGGEKTNSHRFSGLPSALLPNVSYVLAGVRSCCFDIFLCATTAAVGCHIWRLHPFWLNFHPSMLCFSGTDIHCRAADIVV